MTDYILKQLDIWSDRLFTLLFIFILLIGAYISYDMWYVYSHAGADAVAGYKPDEMTDDALKKISENVIAWITIDGTTIDYPVLQGEDNVEYLNKDPFGQYSLSGSIFLDSRNHADFSDNYNIIYGHHMANGYMFGALDSFKKPDYFEKHRTGILYVKNQEYRLRTIGFLITDANVNAVFDTDFSGDRTLFFEKYSVSTEDMRQGRLVALTTCKEPLTTTRTVLLCVIEGAVGDEKRESVNFNDMLNRKEENND